jgi:hypothetical protein
LYCELQASKGTLPYLPGMAVVQLGAAVAAVAEGGEEDVDVIAGRCEREKRETGLKVECSQTPGPWSLLYVSVRCCARRTQQRRQGPACLEERGGERTLMEGQVYPAAEYYARLVLQA